MRAVAVRTIAPGPIPGSKNTGPIADGAPALAKARETLLDSEISLAGVAHTQIFATKRLFEAYVDAKRAANLLEVASSDPRTQFTAEFALAADHAKKAARMIGTTIVALKQVDGELTPRDKDIASRRLKAAHEVLGRATIGAFTGTHY